MAARKLPQIPISRPTPNDDDVFERLPDAVLLHIFTIIADIKTLIRCRDVSSRFNFIVPQVETLFLKVDHPLGSSDSLLTGLVKSLQNLVWTSKPGQNSVAQIVRGFDNVKHLLIEPPVEYLKVRNEEFVRWKAFFGKGLIGCAVVGMKSVNSEAVVDAVIVEAESEREANVSMSLRNGAEWMVNALATACKWHNALKEVVKEQNEMKLLEVRDKEEKGSLIMFANSLEECRKAEELVGETRGKNRVTVPAVRYVVWYKKKLELGNGVIVDGPMVVTSRPLDAVKGETTPCSCCAVHFDMGLALGAFDGMYGEIAMQMVKERYEMFGTGEFHF